MDVLIQSLFFAMLRLSCQKRKKEYKLKTKLTSNNWVFSIVKPILNHNSIQQSILRERINTKMLWLTADLDCWTVWKKKWFVHQKQYFWWKNEQFQNFGKKHFQKGNKWIDKVLTHFAFWKTSVFYKINSPTSDFLGFWIFAFSMQIHSFPF